MPIPMLKSMLARDTSSHVNHLSELPLVLPILQRLRVTVAATSAIFVCLPLLFAPRPKTPLRVFCIAAFDFLARLCGGTLGKQRQQAIALACDFGSLCDKFYDHHSLDRSEYRFLRRELRRHVPGAATSSYIRQLRQAERTRPILSPNCTGIVQAVIAYRTSVLDLSLRWMQAISGLSAQDAKLHPLLHLVGLMQITDDVLDWKDDQAVQCPSYVTALLLDRPKNNIAIPLRTQADALLRELFDAARQDVATLPFAVAGALTWPILAVLIKLRFPQ